MYIFFFIRQIPNPTIAASARTNAKEREKKERQVKKARKKKELKLRNLFSLPPTLAK